MAKDDFINQKINEYQQEVRETAADPSPLKLHRILRLFAKEVERETRHAAAELAMKLHNDIVNL